MTELRRPYDEAGHAARHPLKFLRQDAFELRHSGIAGAFEEIGECNVERVAIGNGMAEAQRLRQAGTQRPDRLLLLAASRFEIRAITVFSGQKRLGLMAMVNFGPNRSPLRRVSKIR